MTTTIDNNQRLFIVQRNGFSSDKVACNLKDIPKAIREFETNDSLTVHEFWSGRLKKCSKKHLREMLEANQIDYPKAILK